MDEIGSGYTTEAEMVKRALRKPFVLEAIRLLTRLSSTEIVAAIDELTEEPTDWLDPHAVDAVAVIINRTRGEQVPVDTEDRLGAVEALEDARRAAMRQNLLGAQG
jgi:threonine synthase